MSSPIRIDNPQYKANPALAQVAQQATPASDNFLGATHLALANLWEVARKPEADTGASYKVHDEMIPQLVQPKTNEEKEPASLMELLLDLQDLLKDVELAKMKSDLDLYKSRSAAQNASAKVLAEKCEQAVVEYEAATKALQNDKNALDQAFKDLAEKEKYLKSLSLNNPNYVAAHKAVTVAKQAVVDAENAVMLSINNVTAASEKMNDLIRQLQTIDQPDQVVIVEKAKAGSADVARIMAELQKLISENSQTELTDSMELFKKQQEAVQKELEIKAKEFEEERRKAEQLKEVMGLIGKIIGPLLMVFSVIGAVFSGGASLALAAVSVALFATDQIMVAAGEEALTSMILKPVMEGVVKPLMEGLTKVFTDLCEAMGIDKDVSKILSSIMSALAMVAAVVAIAVVGKKSASKLSEKFGAKIAESISRIVPDLMKSAAQTVSSGLHSVGSAVSSGASKALSKVGIDGTERTAKFVNKMQIALPIAHVTHSTSQATASIIVGEFERIKAFLLASMSKDQMNKDILEELIAAVFDIVIRSLGVVEEIMKIMSDALQKHSQTTLLVADNLQIRS